MDWNQFIQEVLMVIITGLAGAVTLMVKNYLKDRKVLDWLDKKEMLAAKGVEFARQAYTDLEAEQQVKVALRWVAEELTDLGIHYTEDEITGLVRAAIYEIEHIWTME